MINFRNGRYPLVFVIITALALVWAFLDGFLPAVAFLGYSEHLKLPAVWFLGCLASIVGGLLIYRNRRGLGTTCVIAGVLFLAIGFFLPALRLLPLQPPLLADEEVISKVEVVDYTGDEEVLLASCTERMAIINLASMLRQAQTTHQCECRAQGGLMLQVTDDHQERIGFLTDYDEKYYDLIRAGVRRNYWYRVPRAEFISAMESLGVEAERIPRFHF